MTLNCIIVDDEPLALDLLESYVSRRTPFLHLVGRYDNALDVTFRLLEKESIEVAFLDIQMPELERPGALPYYRK